MLPPLRMHSVFALDVRYKGVDDWDDLSQSWLLYFTRICPVCHKLIYASTQRLGSFCGCENVTWRLNLTVTTDDLPPFPWTISQVRTRALQIVAESAATKRGKVAREIIKKLVAEYGKNAVDDAI